jgi:uncharacterized protein YdeI (YjbR/CyaY-like superfamily)
VRRPLGCGRIGAPAAGVALAASVRRPLGCGRAEAVAASDRPAARVRRNTESMASTKPDPPILQFDDQGAWAKWLEQNHAESQGVRLKLAKRGSGARTVTYGEALEEALCYGWIDGQVGRYDDSFYLQRFTPRTKRSKWSANNRDRVQRLLAEGRMKPAGLKAVEAAKADGRWEAAYPGQSRATVPEDLQLALDENPRAKAFFERLSAQNRYAFVFRLHGVKGPETRAKRIAQYVAMLHEHLTFH